VALAEFIKEKVRSNDRITRKVIADEAGVSVKTIERAIKEIENLQYVGTVPASGYFFPPSIGLKVSTFQRVISFHPPHSFNL
jgi:DNA-binding GntR family transcriptional regulator